MGSPPQMETTGAPHSSDAVTHCSTVMISLMVDLYSRILPHPVHVRLHECNGSSINTIGNFCVPRKRCVATYRARFAVILNGYLNSLSQAYAHRIPRAATAARKTGRFCSLYCDTARARTAENNSGTNDISDKKRKEI